MTLHLYFARRFLWPSSRVLAFFAVILVFVDLIEQLRRFGDEAAASRRLLALALLNVPESLYQILPLVMILATIALFLGLARSSELVVDPRRRPLGPRALCAPADRRAAGRGAGGGHAEPDRRSHLEALRDLRERLFLGQRRSVLSISARGTLAAAGRRPRARR